MGHSSRLEMEGVQKDEEERGERRCKKKIGDR